MDNFKSSKTEIEEEIKVNEEKWKKESELTRNLMDLRMKKFSENGKEKNDPEIKKEIEKVKKEIGKIHNCYLDTFMLK